MQMTTEKYVRLVKTKRCVMQTATAVTALLSLLALLPIGCGKAANPNPSTEAASSSAVVVLCDTNFAAQTKQGVVLVDFFATWCAPCRQQGPIVEKVAEQLKGRAVVGKLDVDLAPEMARKFRINGIPALIVFRNGEPVKQFVGVTEADELVAAITSALVVQP
jgi:thioredoxin 1